jgi:rare lipoprotein A
MKPFLFAVLVFTLLVTGCSHRPATVAVPPAPPPAAQSGPIVTTNSPELEIPADTKPLLVETGIASWYGAPYHNRRASNGEVYDMHAMTAAHRTLPLGSIVRVTNLESKQSATVRITDRGPFIEGRIVDLSEAAAQKIGMLQKGTVQVELEVLKTPVPLSNGGRWAVQIGGFDQEKAARELASHLARRYHTANVVTFTSPVGAWWVRVRVKDDLRTRAEEVARDTKTSEGAIFLVRLD